VFLIFIFYFLLVFSCEFILKTPIPPPIFPFFGLKIPFSSLKTPIFASKIHFSRPKMPKNRYFSPHFLAISGVFFGIIGARCAFFEDISSVFPAKTAVPAPFFAGFPAGARVLMDARRAIVHFRGNVGAFLRFLADFAHISSKYAALDRPKKRFSAAFSAFLL
jgi:hypothetical protein